MDIHESELPGEKFGQGVLFRQIGLQRNKFATTGIGSLSL